MKYTVLLLLALTTGLFGQTYQLVWEDEFNGSQLNTEKWIYETGPNWSNNELQYYSNRPENIQVRDGMLMIKGLKENYGGRAYTSARIKTKDVWKYGKFEARIRLPYSQGIWPAFWMLGENIKTVGWPKCGEIDIMEMVGGGPGRDNRTYGTLHWDNNNQHAQYGTNYTLSSGIFADDFHIFSAIWDERKVECYVDGNRFFTIDITPAGLSEFHQPFFMILNMAIGGTWPGNPDGTTVFPQTMYIDYVRVYQKPASVPVVLISAPDAFQKFEPYSDIKVKTGIAYSGKIDRVEFYQGNIKIGETSTAPYEMTWKNVYPGCYKLKAKAITAEGFYGESKVTEIRVGEGCGKAPYGGIPVKVPGIVEAENFDLGGEGAGYHNINGTGGSAYRPGEDVEVEECEDVRGDYNVTGTADGEWLNYSIDVKESGIYDIKVRYAAYQPFGGSFYITADGEDVTGEITVPTTNGYQIWESAVKEGVNLSAGVKEMKLHITVGEFNVNYIEIVPKDAKAEIDMITPDGGEVWGAGTVQEIRWDSYMVDNVQIGFTSDNGGTWSFITAQATSEFGVYRWLVPDIRSEQCKIMVMAKGNSTIKDATEGVFTITEVSGAEDEAAAPVSYGLKQNYPNPFNPATVINYSVAEAGEVELRVYSVLGEEAAVLVSGYKEAGEHSVNFDAAELRSGIYFYTLRAGGYVETRKMVVLK